MVEFLSIAHVVIEHWEAVSDAIELHRQGLEFADALHWTGSAHCREFVSFDVRRFVRRTRRMKRMPEVVIAK